MYRGISGWFRAARDACATRAPGSIGTTYQPLVLLITGTPAEVAAAFAAAAAYMALAATLSHVAAAAIMALILGSLALVAGGALLTEVVFGLPGVGLLTYNSLVRLDLPVIMATVIYGAFFITIMSAIVDIVYARLDPRIRPT